MFCEFCGTKLEKKELLNEGMIPYCPNCKEYRFPKFSVGMLAIILSPDQSEVLLIKQYDTSFYRLVAGYTNKGESLEETLVREVKEEVSLDLVSYKPLTSSYWEKSNTLLECFVAVAKNKEVVPNYEVQEYKWFKLTDAYKALDGAKLAYKFFDYFMKNN